MSQRSRPSNTQYSDEKKKAIYLFHTITGGSTGAMKVASMRHATTLEDKPSDVVKYSIFDVVKEGKKYTITPRE